MLVRYYVHLLAIHIPTPLSAMHAALTCGWVMDARKLVKEAVVSANSKSFPFSF